MMEVYVSSEIIIHNPSQMVMDYAKEKLTIDNPDYVKKQRMGKWLGKTPRVFSLYSMIQPRVICMPFGCLYDIWKMMDMAERDFAVAKMEDKELVVRCTDEMQKSLPSFHTVIRPYKYQANVIWVAGLRKSGIIVMPCGSGKTQVGLALACGLRGRTLWLTHTTELLNQSMSRAKAMFPMLSAEDCGTITAGKVSIGNVFTFATVQTMVNLNLDLLADTWPIVIVDECHRAIGAPTRMMMFYKVLSKLKAWHKYGLTATPERPDGMTEAMHALLGPVIARVEKGQIQQAVVPVKVRRIETAYEPDRKDITRHDGTLDYTKAISAMIANEDRNNLIADDICRLAGEGGSILVLSERVAHLTNLRQMVGYMDESIFLSTASKSGRAGALEAMQDGTVQILYATYQLAKEGLDIPCLTDVIFATPQKNETTVIQAMGRVARKHGSKEYGIVHDYVDAGLLYRRMARTRQKIYQNENCEV